MKLQAVFSSKYESKNIKLSPAAIFGWHFKDQNALSNITVTSNWITSKSCDSMYTYPVIFSCRW